MVDRPGISTCSRSFARGRCETSASCGLRLDRHDGESPALIAGPGRLDGGVEGEQVGLEGDLVDDADDLGDRLDSTASSAAWRAWSEFCFTVRRSRSVVRSFWTAASSFSHPARYFLSRAWRPRSVAASTKAARAPERSTSAGNRRFRRGVRPACGGRSCPRSCRPPSRRYWWRGRPRAPGSARRGSDGARGRWSWGRPS